MREKPLILVVDDEPDFLEIMTTKLRASGFDTATASNGSDAITLAGSLIPDLILMDIFMPGSPTGTDVALTIKQNQSTKDLKIAFLTSMKAPWPGIQGNFTEVSKELGMEDFLEKSDDLNVNVQKIKSILSAK